MRTYRPLILSLLLLLLASSAGLFWLLQSHSNSASMFVSLPTLAATAALPTSLPASTRAALARATLPPTFTPNALPVEPLATETPMLTLSPTSSTTPFPQAQESAATILPSTIEPTVNGLEFPTATLLPSSAGLGLPCPDDPRLKPDYQRYFLAGQLWQAPARDLPVSHFWLSKPFPGNGRFLTNQAFPYGYDGGGRLLLHNGVDAAEPLGTPVLAVADGTITVAQDDRGQLFGWRCDWYGHLIVLELDQTWLGLPVYVLYGHVLEISVESGQRVRRGQQVAEVGYGGAATAAHLHLEVRFGSNEFGATRNPALWMDPATRGVIAGRLLDPLGRPWRGVALSLIGRSQDASSGTTWSYMVDPLQIVNINPDESLAENFVFSDVKPGEYDVYTKIQGIEYRLPITVSTGQVTTLEIITQPYMTPTPDP